MKMITALIFFFPLLASAKEIREFGSSTRALGMGNAYTTVVRDQEALFYNPAGLGRVRGLNWTATSLDFGLNAMNLMSTMGKVTEIESVEDYSQLYGEYVWLGGNGKMALTFPGFGVAYYGHAVIDFELKNPSLPELDATYISDEGFIMGGSVELWDGGYFGAAVKRVIRRGGEETIGIGTIASGELDEVMDEFQAMGVGYGVDLGMLVEMGGPLNSVLSVAWQDVGYTRFIGVSGRETPKIQRDNLTVGLGGSVDLPLMTLSAGIDVRHILDISEQFGKKLHIGGELSMPLIDIRGGFSQGYYTYGAGLDLYFFRFDVASYGVERGVYPGQQEDRRFQAEMKIEFGLDPDFNLFGLSGAGQGSAEAANVKQRR